jgi:hypothetical protein
MWMKRGLHHPERLHCEAEAEAAGRESERLMMTAMMHRRHPEENHLFGSRDGVTHARDPPHRLAGLSGARDKLVEDRGWEEVDSPTKSQGGSVRARSVTLDGLEKGKRDAATDAAFVLFVRTACLTLRPSAKGQGRLEGSRGPTGEGEPGTKGGVSLHTS